MDAEIEKRAGKPISAIFEGEGEAAFREMEATLCRELSVQQGLVIATGGGALVDPNNRRRMIASGPTFCLWCEPGEIVRRLAHLQDRPLLDVGDRRNEIERLLDARSEAYAAIPRAVHTTGRSINEVAGEVIEQAKSILLPVHYPGGSYPIHIGRGLLGELGALARALPVGQRIAVVTNPTVGALYAGDALAALGDAGLDPALCTMPDGEEYKTLDTLSGLYEQFLKAGLDRSGAVLALGGGVVCDVAGFAAATYMRGVPVIQVPTTLLAMMDASVGGKTAVDLPQGKNLVGAFKQPAGVAIDPVVLDTLPDAEVASGMAELIKHAVLADPELLDELERTPWDEAPRAQWIARSLQVKIEVVEEDPYERGRRAVLNLGHTTGHALEQQSGYGLRHGEGVSIGMVAAARIAAATGRADPTLAERIGAVLQRHGLPVRCPPVGAEGIWEAMGRDKKKQGRALRWVLPNAVGQIEIASDVPRRVVLEVLREMGAS
jgi:3-dehydroquinate synthase